MEFNLFIFVIQILLIIELFALIYYSMKIAKSMKYEKKFNKFSLNSIYDNNGISIFDKLFMKYIAVIKRVSKKLSKSIIINKRCKKYNKYVNINNPNGFKSIDYISSKIIIIISLIIIVLIFDAIQMNGVRILQIIVAILFGYYSVDLYLYSIDKIKIKKIDYDLLQAIIIMNSAFKSGRTTVQAVKIVKEELNGPLKDEFSKIYTDLSFGLGIDEAFSRFAKRINNKDAGYISSSLSVLNKTGGDIVNIFSSIEKSFFTRRKLRNELKSLTSSAQVMFKALVCAPIIISLVIFTLSPDYFLPLINTTIGLILLGLIILIYIGYILVVRKVMKIDM